VLNIFMVKSVFVITILPGSAERERMSFLVGG
jgi:hypothetical protein